MPAKDLVFSKAKFSVLKALFAKSPDSVESVFFFSFYHLSKWQKHKTHFNITSRRRACLWRLAGASSISGLMISAGVDSRLTALKCMNRGYWVDGCVLYIVVLCDIEDNVYFVHISICANVSHNVTSCDIKTADCLLPCPYSSNSVCACL